MKHKNSTTKALIHALQKEKKPIWQRLARELARPSKNGTAVNVGKLARFAEKDCTFVVPGKVLGNGVLDKSITVAAVSFSEAALKKISLAKGKSYSIDELLKKSPEKARIIK